MAVRLTDYEDTTMYKITIKGQGYVEPLLIKRYIVKETSEDNHKAVKERKAYPDLIRKAEELVSEVRNDRSYGIFPDEKLSYTLEYNRYYLGHNAEDRYIKAVL